MSTDPRLADVKAKHPTVFRTVLHTVKNEYARIIFPPAVHVVILHLFISNFIYPIPTKILFLY